MAQNSSNRKRPNILITPTPGTGKTNTAASLVVVTELRHINVGDFANEENLTNDWNDTFVCYYINEDLAGVFDVTKFGATPNGDISKAILDAFKEACASTSASRIIVPKGRFQMKQVKLEGPCKAPLEFQLQGTLEASPDPKILPEGEWFTVNYLNQFTLSGTGIFDGQGKAAWAQNDCAKTKCAHLPYNLSFNFLNSSTIQDITSKDSKNFHMNVNGCNNLTFNRITITAPKESINTDGIHVARSKNVNITDSVIGTGDDCISVGDELEQLHITKVTCGPGHGISVGSLGKTPGEKPVVGVYVKNCTFINTDNGVRVKTWPASHQGVVTELHYEDIIVQNVSNPIVIDQVYCPYNQCNKDPKPFCISWLFGLGSVACCFVLAFWGGKMPERITAEDLLNNIVESIADGLSKQKSLSKQTSGSFLEQEKSSSVNAQLNRLFGRQKPVHHILGGGKSADVLLWRNKKISAGVLASATAIWVLFEWLNYNFLSLLCFALVIGMIIQFLWKNASGMINRSPAKVPRLVLRDDLFISIAKSIGAEVNRVLGFLQDVACGTNIKQFLVVVASLWVAAIIGSWCNFFTVLYIGFVAAHVLPVLYERYDDQVDGFVYNALEKFQCHYQKLDHRVLSRFPTSKFRLKKFE
ncbi:hypothetical protein KY285_032012 [Solanum tuberosum]|nr:hypothetical protein KY285_032012 [Solanum tuberosum]